MKKYLILLALLIIGVTAHSQVMLSKATKYLGITTAVRDGITIAANQFPVIYNTTTGQFEVYDGSQWRKWVTSVDIANLVDTGDTGTVTSTMILNSTIDILDLDAALQTSVGLADTSTQPTDFDTFAELDALVADKSLVNTADAQTLTNKTIDATLNTITNIDETDLDTSVNASLDLADSALQDADVLATTNQTIPALTLRDINLGGATAGTQLRIMQGINPLFQVNGDGTASFQSSSPTVLDDAYGAGWNGDFKVPTKNAVYDKIETLGSGESTTVSDTGEIDLTLTGSDITASLITGSIDVLKLDSGVQTSLGLADSALQEVEGTSVLSTAEVAGTKFLREDGDNSSSWQLITSSSITDGTVATADVADDAITEAKLDMFNAPTDQYYLKYDSTNGMEWSLGSGGGDIYLHPYSVETIDSLYIGPSGHGRTLGATTLEFNTDNTFQLTDLTDVNTSTVTNRNVLVADGVDFESRALTTADISGLGTGVATSLGIANNTTGGYSPINGTATLTNKRITRRVSTIASSATPTPAGNTTDMFTVTALAAGATFAAPTGTPTGGQSLVIRIKDNGTARTLAWNAIYRAGSDFALPTTTVISKTIYLQFIYNSTDSKWDAVGLTQGF